MQKKILIVDFVYGNIIYFTPLPSNILAHAVIYL